MARFPSSSCSKLFLTTTTKSTTARSPICSNPRLCSSIALSTSSTRGLSRPFLLRSSTLSRRPELPPHSSFIRSFSSSSPSTSQTTPPPPPSTTTTSDDDDDLKPAKFQISPLPDSLYHALSELALESLTEWLEEWMDGEGILEGEIEYSSGVLTLTLPPPPNFTKFEYVINKQPPNSQIWLASPLSGPKRYDYDLFHQRWFYHRDNSTFKGLIEDELERYLELIRGEGEGKGIKREGGRGKVRVGMRESLEE